MLTVTVTMWCSSLSVYDNNLVIFFCCTCGYVCKMPLSLSQIADHIVDNSMVSPTAHSDVSYCIRHRIVFVPRGSEQTASIASTWVNDERGCHDGRTSRNRWRKVQQKQSTSQCHSRTNTTNHCQSSHDKWCTMLNRFAPHTVRVAVLLSFPLLFVHL